MKKDFYTVKDISEQLRITEKTVRRLITSGNIKAKKVCRKWIVSARHLSEFLAEEEVTLIE